MKIISKIELFKSIEDFTGVTMIHDRTIDKSEVSDDDLVLKEIKDENGITIKYRVLQLTREGKRLNQVFYTLDCINSIDVTKSHKVVDNYTYEEYIIPEFMKMLVRPARVVSTTEEAYYYQRDLIAEFPQFALMEEDQPLTPEQVINQIVFIFKKINKRFKEFETGSKVSREVETLTMGMVQTYPVIIEGSYYTMLPSKLPKLCVLSHKAYDDDAYDVEITKSIKSSWYDFIARHMMEEAGVLTDSQPGAVKEKIEKNTTETSKSENK